MTENALSILIVIFSIQLQQTETSDRKLFIFQHGCDVTAIVEEALTFGEYISFLLISILKINIKHLNNYVPTGVIFEEIMQ